MVIRYMGKKSNISSKLFQIISKHSDKNKILVDLMAGSGSSFINFEFDKFDKVIFNDVQLYSKYIAQALYPKFKVNKKNVKNHIKKIDEHKCSQSYYQSNFGGLYFSHEHALKIDCYTNYIHNLCDDKLKPLLLSALLYAVCQVQMTTGHFAQYIKLDSPRRNKIAEINFYNAFLSKIDYLSERKVSNFEYKNQDAVQLVNYKNAIYYLDPPYTIDQYSRFYHILETIVKNDFPKLMYKGLYREDRFKSKFSSTRFAKEEFQKYFKKISNLDSILVMSYYNKGVLSISQIKELAKKYFDHIVVQEIKYKHSSQGKGTVKNIEYIMEFYNGKNR